MARTVDQIQADIDFYLRANNRQKLSLPSLKSLQNELEVAKKIETEKDNVPFDPVSFLKSIGGPETNLESATSILSRPEFKNLLPPNAQEVLSPKEALTPPPPPPSEASKTEAPEVFKLLPEEEIPAFQQIAKKEQEEAEAARQKFLTERVPEEEKLLQEISQKEQTEREAARARLVSEAEANIPAILEQARAAIRPGIERGLKRTGDIFGSRGLGSGGLEGSGALQELALKGAKEVEERALPFGLDQYTRALGLSGQLGLEAAQVPAELRRLGLQRQLSRGDIFGQLGLEAAGIPGEYRQGAFERGLTLRDLLEQRKQERELAQLGASSAIDVARQGVRSGRRKGIGSALGAGIGGYFGGLPGASFGSQIGGALGGIF